MSIPGVMVAAVAAAAATLASHARQQRAVVLALAQPRGRRARVSHGDAPAPQHAPPCGVTAACEPLEHCAGDRVKHFSVVRWDAARLGLRPYIATYPVHLDQCGPMVLDALQHIRATQDGSLPCPPSCADGRCGGCVVRVDGVTGRGCQVPIDTDSPAGHRIYPLSARCGGRPQLLA